MSKPDFDLRILFALPGALFVFAVFWLVIVPVLLIGGAVYGCVKR